MSILDYSYYIALMAIGVTFPLITGGVDLSIGTGLICYSLTGGYLIVQKGCPITTRSTMNFCPPSLEITDLFDTLLLPMSSSS